MWGGGGDRGPELQFHHVFGDVARKAGDGFGLFRVGRIAPQHVAVILDRRAAARCGDEDGVEPLARNLRPPGIDIGARGGERIGLAAHVVDERAAAALARRQHHRHAGPVQEPDRRLVDGGRQHRLRATGKKRDAALLPGGGRGFLRCEDRGAGHVAARRGAGRRQRQKRRQPTPARPQMPQHRRQRLCPEGGGHGGAEPAGMGQHEGQHAPQRPVGRRAAIGLLDIAAGVIDQVHVVHAGGARRHAGQAREAAVDVLDRAGIGRAVVFQHVLDQVDAAARAVELVTKQLEGRARRRAETAMDALAQDLFRFRDTRVGELGEGEIGLHGPGACGVGMRGRLIICPV